MAGIEGAAIGAAVSVGVAAYNANSGFSGRHDHSHDAQAAETRRLVDDFEKLRKTGDIADEDYGEYVEKKESAIEASKAYRDSISDYKETDSRNLIKKLKKKQEVRKKKREVRKANQGLQDHYYYSSSGGSDVSSIEVQAGSPPESRSIRDWVTKLPFNDDIEIKRGHHLKGEQGDTEDGHHHHVKVGDKFSEGRYVIVQKLHRSNFSSVWLAKDQKLTRHVALEVVKSGPRHTEAALDEIKLHQRLFTSSSPPMASTSSNLNSPSFVPHTHPGRSHIISFLDHFLHKGKYGAHVCMVFEVPGDSLLDLMERHRRKGVPIPLVKQIAKQISLALDYMHRCCGIIHTDLQPENVLICLDDDGDTGLGQFLTSAKEDRLIMQRWKASDLANDSGQLSLETKGIISPVPMQPELVSVQAHVTGSGEVAGPSKPTNRRLDQQYRDRLESSDDLTASDKITVKVAGLGRATWIERHFTEDIQTKEYRCLEVILGAEWNSSADLWSMACLLFELITGGDYLFDPASGPNYSVDEDHVAQIIELLGENIPQNVALSGKYSSEIFNCEGKLRNITKLRYWLLDAVLHEKYLLPKDEAEAVATFVTPTLHPDPHRRATASELVRQEWLQHTVVQGEINVILWTGAGSSSKQQNTVSRTLVDLGLWGLRESAIEKRNQIERDVMRPVNHSVLNDDTVAKLKDQTMAGGSVSSSAFDSDPNLRDTTTVAESSVSSKKNTLSGASRSIVRVSTSPATNRIP
ncbi:hypothetical protein GALMADRAFT_133811 [Galerina marginata CBS 339.88]|uniref:non-specific serine/threonine protein kinase n=1 Tax=Galerina marginata (strain CBS 339.88) TaxID=685588 RepID=A0A067TZP7_GALM3|nr:hypothetical protein GALMADRAFT_133811 [Galerina marginata CBS 339.88]